MDSSNTCRCVDSSIIHTHHRSEVTRVPNILLVIRITLSSSRSKKLLSKKGNASKTEPENHVKSVGDRAELFF